jgi:hypothetical protein
MAAGLKVTCPLCSQILKSAKPVPEGRRVVCPRCRNSFIVAHAAPPPASGQGGAGVPSAQPGAEAPPPRPAGPPSLPGPSGQAVPSEPPREHRLLLALAVFVGLAAILSLAVYLMWPGAQKDQHPRADSGAPGEGAPPDGGQQTRAPDPHKGRRPAGGDEEGWVAKAGPPPAETAPAPDPLPPEVQTRIDAAVTRGLDFLGRSQQDSGTWDDYHPAGLAALGGLTLLECGIPSEDPRVGKALRNIRAAVPTLASTYDLSLALLFLRRQGDEADRPVIQTLALRLAAGQTPAGGWAYECPLLTAEQERHLLAVLDALRPAAPEHLFAPETATAAPPDKPGPADKKAEDLDGAAGQAFAALPPPLQHLPCLRPPSDAQQLPLGDHSDNSNTQFAALALWGAGRQGLPVERSLALVARHFRFSQSLGGGWDYHYAVPSHASTPSMTCAGLLGLAVGHGLVVHHKAHPTHSARVEDAAAQRAFQTLAGFIGPPGDGADPKTRPAVNLYYLWSLGRVAALYRARKIGGKDWYAWGANLVLDRQEGDGSWKANVYPGGTAVIDTCFALLFLRRSHLTEDLSRPLDFDLSGKKR